MKRGRTYILGLLITLLASLSANAQWSFDMGTVEAYINDHKQQRSLLLARSTLEHGNKLLHEYSREKTMSYKELNVDLDKYTRAFDVIDVMYSFPYDHDNSLDSNLQSVNEKLNEMEQYQKEEVEYSGGMHR